MCAWFEPLFQAVAPRSRHSGGSGLGLAISAAIVHAHGGLIDAHASPLGGLRIAVDLPIQPTPSSMASTRSTAWGIGLNALAWRPETSQNTTPRGHPAMGQSGCGCA